jgi:hypothetical protein
VTELAGHGRIYTVVIDVRTHVRAGHDARKSSAQVLVAVETVLVRTDS